MHQLANRLFPRDVEEGNIGSAVEKTRAILAWSVLVAVGVVIVVAGIMIPPLGLALLFIGATVGLVCLVGWAVGVIHNGY